MTTLLDEPLSHHETSPADRIRSEMIALRLSLTWFGTRKTLSPEQKAVAAESFGAEGDYLSAGKKLLNTKHPKFKAVSSVKNRAVSYVRAMSLPYPEPGLRLIRQDDVTAVTTLLTTFQQELTDAVEELDQNFDELKFIAGQHVRGRNAAIGRQALEAIRRFPDIPRDRGEGSHWNSSRRDNDSTLALASSNSGMGISTTPYFPPLLIANSRLLLAMNRTLLATMGVV